jgi:hypothetical protein
MEAQNKPISNSIPASATFYSSDLAELFRRNQKKLATASSDFYNLLYVKAKYNDPAAKRLGIWIKETEEQLGDCQEKFLASCHAISAQKKPLGEIKISETELKYELNHPLFRKYADFLQVCDKSYIVLHYRWLLGEITENVLQNALKQIINASDKFFSRINYLVKSAQKPFGGIYSNIAIKACLTDKYAEMVDENVSENTKVLEKINSSNKSTTQTIEQADEELEAAQQVSTPNSSDDESLKEAQEQSSQAEVA